jgi:nitrate/nitrite transporter NarK
MQWFRPRERGFAMAVRTCALPGGAALAAVALPLIAVDGDTRAAF